MKVIVFHRNALAMSLCVHTDAIFTSEGEVAAQMTHVPFMTDVVDLNLFITFTPCHPPLLFLCLYQMHDAA